MNEYYIVNDIDRPCPSLVTQEINGKLYYLDRTKSNYDGMGKERAINIRDFGFDITEEAGEHIEETKQWCCFCIQSLLPRVSWCCG